MNNTLLEILEHNFNNHISGETIAQTLNMTRANIWKEVQKLKNQGYEIESIRNLGYKLISHNGNISPDYIKRSVPDIRDVRFFDTLKSTNSYAKSHDLQPNTLIIANQQTHGRGRFGRAFYSPHKSGIYMSLVLKPQLELNDIQLITVCAGLAVCLALESEHHVTPKIKWLNDILLGEKKLCGILTEGEIELESQSFRRLIVGIGINTDSDPNVPDTLETIYTALNNDPTHLTDRNALIISVLKYFYELYNALPENRNALIEAYKLRSMILGKQITLSTSDGVYTAHDITRDGHLVVIDALKETHVLNSGEVSVKEHTHED